MTICLIKCCVLWTRKDRHIVMSSKISNSVIYRFLQVFWGFGYGFLDTLLSAALSFWSFWHIITICFVIAGLCCIHWCTALYSKAKTERKLIYVTKVRIRSSLIHYACQGVVGTIGKLQAWGKAIPNKGKTDQTGWELLLTDSWHNRQAQFYQHSAFLHTNIFSYCALLSIPIFLTQITA